MLKLSTVILSCALALTGSGANAVDAFDMALIYGPCVGLVGSERIRCMHMEIAAGAPCSGTVEQRLICLEDRIARQAREIVWLKYELDKFNRARASAGGGRLSEP